MKNALTRRIFWGEKDSAVLEKPKMFFSFFCDTRAASSFCDLDEFVALKLLQNFSQFYIADTVALLSQLLYQQGTSDAVGRVVLAYMIWRIISLTVSALKSKLFPD